MSAVGTDLLYDPGNGAITHSPGLWSFFHWDIQKPRSLRSLKISRLCGHRKDILGLWGQGLQTPVKGPIPPARTGQCLRTDHCGVQARVSSPASPPAYHRHCDGLPGHPPVSHHGSPRPEESERRERVQVELEPFWNPP